MERFLSNLGTAGIIVGALGSIPYACLYNVDGGERAVMFNRLGGVAPKPIGEGTHFVVPWFQYPFIYDIRTKPKVITTTTGTKDSLPVIHKTLGPDFDERVLPSIGNEILKAVVVCTVCLVSQARYDAENLLTQRDRVSQDVRDAITERARQFDILLDDVAITHLAYGKEYSKAIEEKQVAQQEAERLKFVVAKAEQERKAAVIRAEGEAEAAEMVSQALRDHGSGIIEIRRIDASKEIATTLAKSRNVTYLPSAGNMLLNLPVTSTSGLQ